MGPGVSERSVFTGQAEDVDARALEVASQADVSLRNREAVPTERAADKDSG